MSDIQKSDTEPRLEIGADYFSIFSLKDSYAVDIKELKSCYLAMQKIWHPDKFTDQSETVQREAVQRAAYLNQAYEALKSPVRRAIYMLEREGLSFNADSQTHSDISFLMEQMALRERLENVVNQADPFTELEALATLSANEYEICQSTFQSAYEKQDWPAATACIHKMMFVTKLLDEITLKEEHLDS